MRKTRCFDWIPTAWILLIFSNKLLDIVCCRSTRKSKIFILDLRSCNKLIKTVERLKKYIKNQFHVKNQFIFTISFYYITFI